MRARRTRTTGRPTSANGASSFHLWWSPTPPPATRVEVDLEILTQPATPDLVFWALQASFAEGGQRTGGAHLGLQWHRDHPSSTAVNWGGYHDRGGVLEGTVSDLPSATGNQNTRDYRWKVGVVYTLTIDQGRDPGWWRGSIIDGSTGRTQVVRELHGGGRALISPVVWSEVFSPCEAPSIEVRWSRPRLWTIDGSLWHPDGYRVNYQHFSDGGCTNTDVSVDGVGVVQRTATSRRTRTGALISLA